MTAHGGRYLEIGNINVGWDTEFDPSVIVFKSISVIGIAHYKAQDLRNALNFLVDYKDQLPFDRILSHQFPLSQIDHAMEQQDKGYITRSALIPGELEGRRVRLVDVSGAVGLLGRGLVAGVSSHPHPTTHADALRQGRGTSGARASRAPRGGGH